MINAALPWRPLGTILAEQGLLTETELELALTEQARTGRLLGQILVDRGFVTAFSLARVLSEQHGVELRPTLAPAEPAGAPADEPAEAATWRPLGRVLVEDGFVRQAELDKALDVQRERGGRLGELLIARGSLSGADLARALARQHGVRLEHVDDLDRADNVVVMRPPAPWEPVYQVCEVSFRPGYQTRTVLYENSNFLECVDFAFELVEEREPAAVEIVRTQDSSSETVWTYSASRAAALEASRTDLVDTFGFDPIRWGHDSP